MRLQASMRENTVGKSRREPVPHQLSTTRSSPHSQGHHRQACFSSHGISRTTPLTHLAMRENSLRCRTARRAGLFV